MTKLTLMSLVACILAFGFFNIVNSAGESHVEADEEPSPFDVSNNDEESERSGSRAFASISIRPMPGRLTARPSFAPATLGLKVVECYACTDCPKVLSNTTYKLCPLNLDGSRKKSCVVYSEQYRHMKRPWYIRGCASERGTCTDIKQAHAHHSEIVQLLSCSECEGDRCNKSGAPRSLSNLTVAFIALVVTPLVAKYTLS